MSENCNSLKYWIISPLWRKPDVLDEFVAMRPHLGGFVLDLCHPAGSVGHNHSLWMNTEGFWSFSSISAVVHVPVCLPPHVTPVAASPSDFNAPLPGQCASILPSAGPILHLSFSLWWNSEQRANELSLNMRLRQRICISPIALLLSDRWLMMGREVASLTLVSALKTN